MGRAISQKRILKGPHLPEKGSAIKTGRSWIRNKGRGTPSTFTLHVEAQLLHVPCLLSCASPQQGLRGSLTHQEEQTEWQRARLLPAHWLCFPQLRQDTEAWLQLYSQTPRAGEPTEGKCGHGMDTTQAPGVRHLLHRAWLGFPPGAGYAEGDVLVTLLSGTTVCAALSISKGKGQKSGVWVLCCTGIQAQAEERGDTSNTK